VFELIAEARFTFTGVALVAVLPDDE